MDWLYVIASIVAIVFVAFLLGWANKNVKSPAVQTAIGIGSVVFLLALRFGFRDTWEFSLRVSTLAARTLNRTPSWLIITVVGVVIALAWRYVLILIAGSIADLGIELEAATARIALLESSLRDKLDEISSRLPERD